MIKIVSFSGSPVRQSSTELLLSEIAEACLAELAPVQTEHELIRLSERSFVQCEACGKAPTPDFCIYHEIDDWYDKLAEADGVLFGSPIYFDSVSAQAKSFIDRCNCFRPADFDGADGGQNFRKLLVDKRAGAIVLVGSQNAWFEGARRTIAGFFKWTEIVNMGELFYQSNDFRKAGSVAGDAGKLAQAHVLGALLAGKIREQHREK